jgi:hypothetical protein
MMSGRDMAQRGAANMPMPQFSSYNECRAWLASPAAGNLTNRGTWTGGEVTMASQDPCLLGGWSS